MEIEIQLRTPELRSALNRMSQAELARQAGLSKTTVSNLESGRLQRIELATIAKLCRALNCTPDDLFSLNLKQDDESVVKAQKRKILALAGAIQSGKRLLPDELGKELAGFTNKSLQSQRKATTKLPKRVR